LFAGDLEKEVKGFTCARYIEWDLGKIDE